MTPCPLKLRSKISRILRWKATCFSPRCTPPHPIAQTVPWGRLLRNSKPLSSCEVTHPLIAVDAAHGARRLLGVAGRSVAVQVGPCRSLRMRCCSAWLLLIFRGGDGAPALHDLSGGPLGFRGLKPGRASLSGDGGEEQNCPTLAIS